MQKNSIFRSAISNRSALVVFVLCGIAMLFSILTFATPTARGTTDSLATSPPDSSFTVVHQFLPAPNSPFAQLIQGSDGNFYGMTFNGGTSNSGTVLQMTPAGVVTTIHSFTGANGANPYGGLIQASDGNFYGTTQYGGANNDGVVSQMTPAGNVTVLHSFSGDDGANPFAGLVQA